jgi:hypothetical protein
LCGRPCGYILSCNVLKLKKKKKEEEKEEKKKI